MKTFGHCGCCIAEQESNIKRQRGGIEYLKYIDSLPEGEQKDRLINKAYEQAKKSRWVRETNLKRYGTTTQGRYKRK